MVVASLLASCSALLLAPPARPPACSGTPRSDLTQFSCNQGRRQVLLGAPALAALLLPSSASAAPYTADPRFVVALPTGYAVTKKGAQTGTVFVGGDFVKAAVVSVTVWPVAELLATDSAAQSLPGLPAAADATAVDVPAVLAGREPADKLVQVLLRARDRENAGNALQSELLGSELANGELRLSFSTQLSVADPDELEKQRGYRELVRRTTARTTLGATAGGQPALVTCWASALKPDWAEVGPPLEETVASFKWVG